MIMYRYSNLTLGQQKLFLYFVKCIVFGAFHCVKAGVVLNYNKTLI